MDPNVLRSAIGLNVGQQVQEGLIDRALKPLLATSWKNLDDKTWQCELRPNVKFHNGDPFDANAMTFTIDRTLDPDNEAPIRTQLPRSGDRVEGDAPTSEKIPTKAPYAVLSEVVLDVGMVPPQGAKAADFGNKGYGTGPYQVKNWARGERV